MSRFANAAMMSHCIAQERNTSTAVRGGSYRPPSTENPITLAYKQEDGDAGTAVDGKPSSSQRQLYRPQLTVDKLQQHEKQLAPPRSPFAVARTSLTPTLDHRGREVGEGSSRQSDTWSVVGGRVGCELTPIMQPSPTMQQQREADQDEDLPATAKMRQLEDELENERQSRLHLQDQINKVSDELSRQVVVKSKPLPTGKNGKPPLGALKKPIALSPQQEQMLLLRTRQQQRAQSAQLRGAASNGGSRPSSSSSQYSERVRRRVLAERTNIIQPKRVEFKLPSSRATTPTSSRASAAAAGSPGTNHRDVKQ